MNKRFFLPLCLILLLGTCVRAQKSERLDRDDEPRTERRAERFSRIKAARQAFISEHLELTKAEADAFFPVYWREEDKLRNRRRDVRLKRPSGELTEDEAVTLMVARYERLRDAVEGRRAAELAYLEVLPATKVIRLPEAERAFREQLRERVRERRRN